MLFACWCQVSGQSTGQNDVFIKADNAVNKVVNSISIFQPLLLKARQIYYDSRQLVTDTKAAAKQIGGGNHGGWQDSTYKTNAGGYGTGYSGQPSVSYPAVNNTAPGNYPVTPQSYLPSQTLPINNPASVNADGSGNWGNQHNALYGNCLDALTGTVMGMGEALQRPGSVDLLFFAPSDGQNTYYLMTPDFARNDASASAMSNNASEAVKQWSDVNETEVAVTKITLGQFDQIQNNSQIGNAVLNATDYGGYYASVGQKLDGQVFAVRAQMPSRQLYALVAIERQIGTSGSNGYLLIRIKAQNPNNGSSEPNAQSYVR